MSTTTLSLIARPALWIPYAFADSLRKFPRVAYSILAWHRMNRLSQLRICRRASLLTLLSAAFSAQASSLPDTGQTICYNTIGHDSVPASDPASIARDAGTFPRQDCRYGRDAAAAAGVLIKIGDGAKGFDYSKIANDGSTLAANAALGNNAGDWACTRDNITGLIWEVKTTSGLRNMASTYTWFSTDAASNAGNVGINTDTTTCNGTLTSCNTQAYVAAVNAGNGLCNASDWRQPTARELLTLVFAESRHTKHREERRHTTTKSKSTTPAC